MPGELTQIFLLDLNQGKPFVQWVY